MCARKILIVWNFLQSQFIPEGEKANNCEFGEAFHHGKSYYKLFKCRKVSKNKNAAFYNLLLRTGEHLYEHSKIQKVFHDEYSPDQHRSVHDVERPYDCRECGKSFKQVQALTVHQRIHVEKPYQCREYGKSFKQLDALTIYQRIHTV